MGTKDFGATFDTVQVAFFWHCFTQDAALEFMKWMDVEFPASDEKPAPQNSWPYIDVHNNGLMFAQAVCRAE